MIPTIKIDMSQFNRALQIATLTEGDLLNIEGAGAFVLVNGMRRRVAVDTAATKNSVKPHLISSSEQRVEDHIGPETDYSVHLEYGHKTPSGSFIPAQPFVRPTVSEDGDKAQAAMTAAFGKAVSGG
jgi:hypothetical protein